MKTVLGWLCDPYVHVIVIGLVLVRIAMGSGADGPVEVASSAVYCERCQDFHEGWTSNGSHYATVVVDVLMQH